jgi:hypothetical protein
MSDQTDNEGVATPPTVTEEFGCAECGAPRDPSVPGALCPACKKRVGYVEEPPELDDEDEEILDRVWERLADAGS